MPMDAPTVDPPAPPPALPPDAGATPVEAAARAGTVRRPRRSRPLTREFRRMGRSPWKFVRGLLGILLLLLGVVAGPIPILQGWVFVLIGLGLLGSISPRARLLRIRLLRKARAWRGKRSPP